MRCFVMFVTAVCVLFLLKLKWPKNKSFYNSGHDASKSPLAFSFTISGFFFLSKK